MSSRADFAYPLSARVGREIIEPRQWPNDHGARREPVIDPNWNDRVVRRVGWRTCMHCQRWFFSRDVSRVRLHAECGRPNEDML